MKRKERDRKNICRDNGEIFPKFDKKIKKNMSLHIHETQRTPRRISGKIHTEPHCNQIIKTQGQKRIWKTAKEKQLTTHTKDLQ